MSYPLDDAMRKSCGIAAAALAVVAVALLAPGAAGGANARLGEQRERAPRVREYVVPAGSRPHDVAPARDGTVWYTAQGTGKLGGWIPATGNVIEVELGEGSAPHGVIVGPDGAAWVTDGGLNAIVRVDHGTLAVKRYPLPASSGYANLNTATFDRRGRLWFTGQSGIYGRLDPRSGALRVFTAPGGSGPTGSRRLPPARSGTPRSPAATSPGSTSPPARRRSSSPDAGGGARRIWPDSSGRLWVSEWNAGRVARYDPKSRRWKEWRLPGAAQPYAVYVDDRDSSG